MIVFWVTRMGWSFLPGAVAGGPAHSAVAVTGGGWPPQPVVQSPDLGRLGHIDRFRPMGQYLSAE